MKLASYIAGGKECYGVVSGDGVITMRGHASLRDALAAGALEGMRNAAEVGKHIMDRISGWPKKHPMVGDVRGRGLMIGVEIVADQKSKTPAQKDRDRIVELAFERGVLFLGAGETALRIAPPLIVTREQADIALDVLEECISIIEKEAK